MTDFTTTFTTEISVPFERIEDLLIAAFEGGSNYWCRGSTTLKNPYSFSTYKEHWFIEIIDIEDPSNQKYTLTLDNLYKGYSLFPKYKRNFNNFINENEDAEDADVFLQLCIFGEVIYG